MPRDKSLASEDPYDLQRFVAAQAPVYDTVLAELRAGRKRSHWIWYVFPQLRGLGRSATAERFGIGSLDEARAYLDHDVLGPRLRECAQLVAGSAQVSAVELFGRPDDLKVRSSMTLFSRAADDPDLAAVFSAVLDKYYSGEPDPLTVEKLSAQR
ncbi:Uncharacterized protein, DUF1810 family [Mycolicibacterium rutilum]|uniref:Uncharacterized protein, DUF1810 family n=1 Tax=Mycolicibacterium rutilum TaxID=370526 RepID=A0A1H6KZ94_MYCRU|nr:DUF1810 domain-containing protein [Mycolicibacterium rutilum]SEH78332.1 Uncharacterized protein, DUF1810 family [Mycolicibacterium rutilum]